MKLITIVSHKGIVFITALLVCLLLLGCGSVSGKKELISYAETKFGEAECVKYTSNSEEAEVTLRDAEYGFDYTVRSYMSDILVDGSSFGSIESKTSDFYEKYITYLQSSESDVFNNVKSNYGCQIVWTEYPSNDCILISLQLADQSELTPLYEIAEIVNTYDTRRAFGDAMIKVYYNTEVLGVYDFGTGEYLNIDEATTKWFMEAAYSIMTGQMQMDIHSCDELTFLYKETLTVEEIKNYADFELAYRITDTEESLANTEVYHFSFQGEEWMIADCLTSPDGNLLVAKLK